jgi:hypothetical protein
MSQICDIGQDGFYFPSEEGVLRFIRAGLNQRTWILKASTLPLATEAALYDELAK